MQAKSFISQSGQLVGNGGDHADIARRHLAALAIVPRDYEDLYNQMFRLGFARSSEDSSQFHIERPAGLSRAQQKLVQDKLFDGKEVFINDRRYVESKLVRGTMSLADQLLAGRD